MVFAACGGDSASPAGPAGSTEAPDTVVDSIWVDPAERTIGVLGTQFWVGAAALAEDGTILYGSTLNPGRFSWSSSAPDVATIDKDTVLINGASVRLLTGVSQGTATITATSSGVSGSMTVTVRDRAHLAWSVPTGKGLTQADVAIGADGTIYVGTTDFAGHRSVLYAVSPQGGVLWTVGLPFITGRSMPAIGADGTLYLGSWTNSGLAGSLVAVDPAGAIRWLLDDLEAIWSSPALGPDGTIYVAGGRHVHAIDPHGEIQWTYEGDERTFTFSSPAVASDGTIYVGGNDALLHAINPDGSPRWTFTTGGERITSSPAIGTDGTIYLGSGRDDGRLYALNSDGTERWRSAELDFRGLSSSPSIGPDGTIYIGGNGTFAVDPGGSIRWHFPGSQVATTPILGADGNVYIAAAGGVTALDTQGRLLWDYTLGGSNFGSPAIGVDGMIIATSLPSSSSDGTIQAIVETPSTNGGYAGSPWPTKRGDRASSGRAGG